MFKVGYIGPGDGSMYEASSSPTHTIARKMMTFLRIGDHVLRDDGSVGTEAADARFAATHGPYHFESYSGFTEVRTTISPG